MVRKFRKKELEILVCVDLIGLSSFYETIQDGTGFRSVIGLDYDEVLPADGERTDGLFGVVVIQGNVSI